MVISYKAELIGVLGHPVAENPTCVMHEAAFAVAGLNWKYLTIEVTPAGLPDAIRGIRAMNFLGVNLTIPHKVSVMPLLDHIMPDAAKIGAVNTVRREGDRLIGENTDGKGFLRALRDDVHLDPKGKNIVILGAGGAARAIAVELALAGAAALTIVNRTAERGQTMVRDLVDRTGANARLLPWNDTYQVEPAADVLVNATSIGLYPDTSTPNVSLDRARPDLIVADAIPNPPETVFIQTARARGHRVLTGLSMLVYQGVIGYEMWTGQKPSEAAMKAALEKAFTVPAA